MDAGAFRGAALVEGAGFVRRTYERGATRVEATLADAGQARVSLSQWKAMSAPYPPVALDVPDGAATGFFDCSANDAGAERCDAHVHFRAGYHLELFGQGTASRADLDALLAALPLRRLAAARPE